MMAKRTPRAVGYARVSTDRQADAGNGLAAQTDAIRAAAARLGLDLFDIFTDEGASGAAPLDKRPALAEALEALGPGDVLLVAKRDRLGRDPLLVGFLEKEAARRRARIVSAAGEGTDGEEGDPTSALMRRIVDAFAAYERDIIRARTRAALAAKRRRGEAWNHAPLGFRRRGARLVADAREAETIGRIEALAASGRSLREIAATLSAEGRRTKRGGRWAAETVRSILNRIRRDRLPKAA